MKSQLETRKRPTQPEMKHGFALVHALRTDAHEDCANDERRTLLLDAAREIEQLVFETRDLETRKTALLKACEGLLRQLEGPAAVYGDGRGNDGRKTGPSHAEFNQLRADCLAKARAVIAKAQGAV